METLEATIEQMNARQRDTMIAALKYWKRDGRRSTSVVDTMIANRSGPMLSAREIDTLIALVDGAA